MNVNPFRIEQVSFSKMSLASRCMRKYWYRYIMGKRETMPAMVVGRAIHRGQEFDNLGKLEGKAYPLGEVLDAAVECFKEEAKKDDLKMPVDPFVAEHKHQLEVYQETGQRDLVRPVKDTVESAFEIPVTVDGVPVVIGGFVDVVSQLDEKTDKEVIDYKSSKKSFSQYDVDGSLQFQLYCAGAEAKAAKVISFVMSGKQRPTVKSTRPAAATELRQRKMWTWVADTIRDIRRCQKEDHWPKCYPELFYCPCCDFHELCYGNTAEDMKKVITIGAVRPAGTVPLPEWRKNK